MPGVALGRRRGGEADCAPMGFDATGKQRRRRADPWIVAAAVAVCLLLVLWALLG